MNPRTIALWVATLAAALLATGCAGPDRPVRSTLYDFGPGATQPQPANRMAPLPSIALAEIDAGGALDSSAMLYRLGYADANQLRPMPRHAGRPHPRSWCASVCASSCRSGAWC
jgi:cholesterol transport system auxiliary component